MADAGVHVAVGLNEAAGETLPESVASICLVLAIGLFVMTFVFQNYEIPSGSMETTLLIGDHVLVDRMTFAPAGRWEPFTFHRPARRGDVIVFFKPHPETPDLHLVKRLIGLPGDRIHLRDGVLFLNGVAQTEPYAAMPRNGRISYRDDFPQDPEGLKAADQGEKTSLGERVRFMGQVVLHFFDETRWGRTLHVVR